MENLRTDRRHSLLLSHPSKNFGSGAKKLNKISHSTFHKRPLLDFINWFQDIWWRLVGFLFNWSKTWKDHLLLLTVAVISAVINMLKTKYTDHLVALQVTLRSWSTFGQLYCIGQLYCSISFKCCIWCVKLHLLKQGFSKYPVIR